MILLGKYVDLNQKNSLPSFGCLDICLRLSYFHVRLTHCVFAGLQRVPGEEIAFAKHVGDDFGVWRCWLQCPETACISLTHSIFDFLVARIHRCWTLCAVLPNSYVGEELACSSVPSVQDRWSQIERLILIGHWTLNEHGDDDDFELRYETCAMCAGQCNQDAQDAWV